MSTCSRSPTTPVATRCSLPTRSGTDLVARGQEVVIHLSCKDWNRNALESRAWKLSSEGFDNVLALSGDYPITGHRGLAAPVFDIDSVGLISLLAEMNEGLRDTRKPGRPARPDGLPRRLRRHESQAPRARGDAAVLQAAEEGRRGSAFRDQPDRLERAQGRRAAALDQARRARRLGDRERLPALADCRARLPSGEDPRCRRHGRAARGRRALRRRRGPRAGVLRRARGEARCDRTRPRLRRCLHGRPHAGSPVR